MLPLRLITAVSLLIIPLAAAAASSGSLAAKQKNQSIQRGKAFATTHCSSCHSIGTEGRSKHSKAPPFRILSKKYPIRDLEEALAEGIVVGHKSVMPVFSMTPDQIEDFFAFVESISAKRR